MRLKMGSRVPTTKPKVITKAQKEAKTIENYDLTAYYRQKELHL